MTTFSVRQTGFISSLSQTRQRSFGVWVIFVQPDAAVVNYALAPTPTPTLLGIGIRQSSRRDQQRRGSEQGVKARIEDIPDPNRFSSSYPAPRNRFITSCPSVTISTHPTPPQVGHGLHLDGREFERYSTSAKARHSGLGFGLWSGLGSG